VVFVTFSLQFFSLTARLPAALRLSADVWERGFVWQLFTYPYIGTGRPGLWFVVGLVILVMFGRSVYQRLGRRGFWTLLLYVTTASALLAVLVRWAVGWLIGSSSTVAHFSLMQGQHMLLTVLIAAFAVLHREATIYLFFVLPIQARWFLLLEIVFAFLGFLATHDLAGFVGLCGGVGATVVLLQPGGAGKAWRRFQLRARAMWLRWRLTWLKRKRGMRIVRGEDRDDEDRWIH